MAYATRYNRSDREPLTNNDHLFLIDCPIKEYRKWHAQLLYSKRWRDFERPDETLRYLSADNFTLLRRDVGDFARKQRRKKKRNELSNSVLWNGITKINLLLDISIARLSQAKCESSILSNIYTYMCVCMCILTDWFTNDLKIWNLLRKHEFLFEQWNYQHVSIRSIPNN